MTSCLVLSRALTSSQPPLYAAPHDILEIRRLLDSRKCDFIKIVAKIENHEGVGKHRRRSVNVADGIMVARGDMGVEIDFTEIPIIQKDIIWRCV